MEEKLAAKIIVEGSCSKEDQKAIFDAITKALDKVKYKVTKKEYLLIEEAEFTV